MAALAPVADRAFAGLSKLATAITPATKLPSAHATAMSVSPDDDHISARATMVTNEARLSRTNDVSCPRNLSRICPKLLSPTIGRAAARTMSGVVALAL